MLQRNLCSISIALLCSLAATAQSNKPTRKDSVSVSAGISKEQLALEDRLNTTIAAADQTLREGHADDAVKGYEAALAVVHKEPLLAEQEQRVLKKLGNGYIQANRASDAVPIFSKLLESNKKDCEPESDTLSTCADAQRALAVAKMSAGDFAGGLAVLQQAESNYAKAETQADFHEFAMLSVESQAETKVLEAVALFRMGRSADAASAIEAAIPKFTSVQADKTINIGIRDGAAGSLKEAQILLRRFKSTE
jgi:tetratricopeptide (TPR) repeat protein